MHTNDDKTKQKNIQKSNQKSNQEIIDSFDYLTNAASTQDCTGLIPSTPVDITEIEAYEDLYHFLPPNGKASDIRSSDNAPEEHSYKNRIY